MRSVLLISSELPYPPNNNKKIKSWNLVNFLGKNYDLTIGSILKQEDDLFQDAFLLKAPIKDFFANYVDIEQNPINIIKSYFKRTSFNVYKTWSPQFNQKVQDIAHNFDMLFLDKIETFQYVPKNYQGFVVLYTHNTEYDEWEQSELLNNTLLNSMADFSETAYRKKYLLAACQKADMIFASPNGISNFIQIGANSQKFHTTYYLGDDTQLQLNALKFKDTQKALLFIGDLNYTPHVDGLLWFIKESWPFLKSRHRDLIFYIVGKNPDKRLTDISLNQNNIKITQDTENIEKYYKKCRIFIAPFRFGKGMKVNLLNAMYRGMPIITTIIGTECIETINKENIVIANNTSQIIEQTDILLTDCKLWKKTSENSRKLAQEKYTWERLFNDIKPLIDKGILNKTSII